MSVVFGRACYGVLRFIMESNAKGCEVVVSGKLRGQRAKSMKFVDGLMIHSGDPVNEYVDTAIRHVMLRQGKLTKDLFWVNYTKQWGYFTIVSPSTGMIMFRSFLDFQMFHFKISGLGYT